MAQLFVLTGSDVGRSFQVGHGATLGRNASCTVALRDRSISRQHAHLECDADGRWWLLDDGSRNGLRRAGERLERIELTDNDEVTVGELVLRFRAEQPAADSAAGASSPEAGAAFAEEISLGDEIQLEGADEPLRPEDLGQTELRPGLELARPAAARPPARPEVAPRTAASEPAKAPRAPRTSAPVADRPGSGQVLQYHRVENRRGLFAADLEQLPGAVRAALIVVVVLVAGAACYFAFRGTHFLRSQVDPVVPVDGAISDDG